MCLAVPGKILSLNSGANATIDMLGAQRDVSLRLTPDAAEGDYVLVHAGFAIQVISAEEAAETLRLVEDLADLVDDDLDMGGLPHADDAPGIHVTPHAGDALPNAPLAETPRP